MARAWLLVVLALLACACGTATAFHRHDFSLVPDEAPVVVSEPIDLEEDEEAADNTTRLTKDGFPTSPDEMAELNNKLARQAMIAGLETPKPESNDNDEKLVEIVIDKDLDFSPNVEPGDPPVIRLKPGDKLELGVEARNVNGYLWLHNHVPLVLTTEGNRDILQTQPSITITHVREDDAGVYQCVMVYNKQAVAAYSKTVRVIVVAPPQCPSTEMAFFDGTRACYWIPRTSRVFDAAEEYCAREDKQSHLVSIVDQREHTFLRECVVTGIVDYHECTAVLRALDEGGDAQPAANANADAEGEGGQEELWVGLARRQGEGFSTFVDAKPVDTASRDWMWREGEPSTTTHSDCTVLVNDGAQCRLRTRDCDAQLPFICKVPSGLPAPKAQLREAQADRYNLGPCFKAMKADTTFLTDSRYYVPPACAYPTQFCQTLQDGYCTIKGRDKYSESLAKAQDLLREGTFTSEFDDFAPSDTVRGMGDKQKAQLAKQYATARRTRYTKSTRCRNNEVKCVFMIRDCFLSHLGSELNFATCWFAKSFEGAASGEIFDITHSKDCELEALSYYLSDFHGFGVSDFDSTNSTVFNVTLPFDGRYFRLVPKAPGDTVVTVQGPNDEEAQEVAHGSPTRLYTEADIKTHAHFAITITPPNPTATACTYGVDVFRDRLAHDAQLYSLNIPEIPELDFNAFVTLYDSLVVPNHVARIHMQGNRGIDTPSMVSISVNGMRPYTDSDAVPLLPGPNMVNVRVVAQDGHLGQLYSFVVERERPGVFTETLASTDAKASHIGLFAGTNSVDLQPPFDPQWPLYSAAVPENIEEVSPVVQLSDPHAFFTVNHVAGISNHRHAPQPILSGANVLRVEVLAEDQRTTMTYTITVTRPVTQEVKDSYAPFAVDLDKDTALSEIRIITPLAAPSRTLTEPELEHSETFDNSIDRVYIAVTSYQPGALVTINGNAVYNGASQTSQYKPVARQLLLPGTNKFVISVTCPTTGAEPRSYALSVIREFPPIPDNPSPVSTLRALEYSSGRLFVWSKGLTEATSFMQSDSRLYSGVVSSKVDAIVLLPSTTYHNCYVEVEGNAVLPNTLSQPIPFPLDEQQLSVHVTVAAESRVDEQTSRYVVTFQRASKDVGLRLFATLLGSGMEGGENDAAAYPTVDYLAATSGLRRLTSILFDPARAVAEEAAHFRVVLPRTQNAAVLGLKIHDKARVSVVEGGISVMTLPQLYTRTLDSLGVAPELNANSSALQLEGGEYVTPLAPPRCDEEHHGDLLQALHHRHCQGASVVNPGDLLVLSDEGRRNLVIRVQAEDSDFTQVYRIALLSEDMDKKNMGNTRHSQRNLKVLGFTVGRKMSTGSVLSDSRDFMLSCTDKALGCPALAGMCEGPNIADCCVCGGGNKVDKAYFVYPAWPADHSGDEDEEGAHRHRHSSKVVVQVVFSMPVSHLVQDIAQGSVWTFRANGHEFEVDDSARPIVMPGVWDASVVTIQLDPDDEVLDSMAWVWEREDVSLTWQFSPAVTKLLSLATRRITIKPQRPAELSRAVLDIHPANDWHRLILVFDHPIDRPSITLHRGQKVVLEAWEREPADDDRFSSCSDTLEIGFDDEVWRARQMGTTTPLAAVEGLTMVTKQAYCFHKLSAKLARMQPGADDKPTLEERTAHAVGELPQATHSLGSLVRCGMLGAGRLQEDQDALLQAAVEASSNAETVGLLPLLQQRYADVCEKMDACNPNEVSHDTWRAVVTAEAEQAALYFLQGKYGQGGTWRSENWLHSVYTATTKHTFSLTDPTTVIVDVADARNVLSRLRKAAISGTLGQLYVTVRVEGRGMVDAAGQTIAFDDRVLLKYADGDQGKSFFMYGDTVHGCLCESPPIACDHKHFTYGCAVEETAGSLANSDDHSLAGHCLLSEEHAKEEHMDTPCYQSLAKNPTSCKPNMEGTSPWDTCRFTDHVHDPHDIPVDAYGHFRGDWYHRPPAGGGAVVHAAPEPLSRHLATTTLRPSIGKFAHAVDLMLLPDPAIVAHPADATQRVVDKESEYRNYFDCGDDDPHFTVANGAHGCDRPNGCVCKHFSPPRDLQFAVDAGCDAVVAFYCPASCYVCSTLVAGSVLSPVLPKFEWLQGVPSPSHQFTPLPDRKSFQVGPHMPTAMQLPHLVSPRQVASVSAMTWTGGVSLSWRPPFDGVFGGALESEGYTKAKQAGLGVCDYRVFAPTANVAGLSPYQLASTTRLSVTTTVWDALSFVPATPRSSSAVSRVAHRELADPGECAQVGNVGKRCVHPSTDEMGGWREALSELGQPAMSWHADNAFPMFDEELTHGFCHGCCHRSLYLGNELMSLNELWLLHSGPALSARVVELQCLYPTSGLLDQLMDADIRALVWKSGDSFLYNTPFCLAALATCGPCAFVSQDAPFSFSSGGAMSEAEAIDGRQNVLRFQIQVDKARHTDFTNMNSDKLHTEPLVAYNLQCLDNLWQTRLEHAPMAIDVEPTTLTVGGDLVITTMLPVSESDAEVLPMLHPTITVRVDERNCVKGKAKEWNVEGTLALTTLPDFLSPTKAESSQVHDPVTVTWEVAECFRPLRLRVEVTVERPDHRAFQAATTIMLRSDKEPEPGQSCEMVRPKIITTA